MLGTPQPAQADCHAYLIKDPVRAVVHVSAKALPQAKPIETEYETIQAVCRVSVLVSRFVTYIIPTMAVCAPSRVLKVLTSV